MQPGDFLADFRDVPPVFLYAVSFRLGDGVAAVDSGLLVIHSLFATVVGAVL